MIKMKSIKLFALVLSLLFPAQALSADLIGMLTSQLGISEQQAEGGAGALFQSAKSNMSGSDFSQLSGIVPNMGDLLSAAPKGGDAAAATGLVGNLLGGGKPSATSQLVGQLGEMTGVFSTLGMSADQVMPFVDIVLNYVKSEGGSGMMGTLQSALGLGSGKAEQTKPEEDMVSKGLGKLFGG